MTDDMAALRDRLAKLTGELNRLAGDAPVIIFRDFATKYLKEKLSRPNLRESTKASFEIQVRKHLIPRFGVLPLDKVSNALWLQWIEDESGLTKFFNSRKALMEILHAAKESGALEKVPSLDSPDEYENVGRVLETEEILRIIWRARRPFRFIFYTFWKMGCRPREILQWEFLWIRWKNDKCSIDIPPKASKTGRSRTIPINSRVARLLRRRLDRDPKARFVFPCRTDFGRSQFSYDSAWKTACRRAGVQNAVAYDFRRTAITRWAAEGLPTLYISKLLDTSVGLIEKVYAKESSDVMEGIVK